jgi:hypothetical protein
MENPMSKLLRSFRSAAILLAFASAPAVALDVKGKGDVPYDSGAFSSKPDAQVRQKAVQAAKENALKRHASTFNPAKFRAYQAVESEILASVDKYVIDATVLDDSVNKDARTYSVVVRAAINEAALDARLNDAGGFAKQTVAQGTSAQATNVSFLFVARETDSVRSFAAKSTEVRSQESQRSGQEAQTMKGRGQTTSMSASESTSSMSTIETGGSTLRRNDETKYRVRSASDADAAIKEVFAGAGFEVVDYPDVAANCDGTTPQALRQEFSAADEISGQTRKAAFDAARQCEVGYFAVGTLDVGMSDTDPVTGNKRVYVSVRGQIWNISGKLPRSIVTVGPVQYAGLGPNPEVAMRNALKLAATEGAKVMVDQLNAKAPR